MNIISSPNHPRNWSAPDFRTREHKILCSGLPGRNMANRLKDLNNRAWAQALPPSVATVNVR